MIQLKCVEDIDGKKSAVYVLQNDFIKAELSEFGAAVRSLRVKTKNGEIPVAVTIDSTAMYLKHSSCYMGATIGRVANRIAGAKFTLGGKQYALGINDVKNSLHGGLIGFDRRIFSSEICGDELKFYLVSEDGDGGYPGELRLTTTYKIDGDALCISYFATSDKDTYFAPTNHTYFTLGADDVKDVLLCINADKYTPVNSDLIPTGETADVNNTPFDFTSPKAIGKDINSSHEQLKTVGGGFDHNFVKRGELAAEAYCEKTGVSLEVYSDLPGVQFYSGNFVKDVRSDGRVYDKHDAFCLEPQFFPDSVNQAGFEKPLLKAGETKNHYIKFRFRADKTV